MKFLTLNTHSWNEEDRKAKFWAVIDMIAREKLDVICFQEVNQYHPKGLSARHQQDARQIAQLVVSDTDTEARVMARYHTVQTAVELAPDNYARLVVLALANRGMNYYWSWAPAHIGYDRFDEGVAILSRHDFTAEQIVLSERQWPYTDYHRRVAVKATFPGEEALAVYCSHFSWWQADNTSFQEEWDTLRDDLRALPQSRALFFGDFNQIADSAGEGYAYIRHTTPTLQDSYHTSLAVSGQATIPGEIDGWRGQKTPKRIDYAWVDQRLTVTQYQTVFDGATYPIVSDHFGVMITTA